MGGLFTRIFPVQSYLLDEYTARTASARWRTCEGAKWIYAHAPVLGRGDS